MSVAYYITLDREVDFDYMIDGKVLADSHFDLTGTAVTLDLPQLDTYLTGNECDFEGDEDFEGGEDFEGDESFEAPSPSYHDPADGLAWFKPVLAYFEVEDDQDLEGNEGLCIDLRDCIKILEQCQQAGIKWALAVDY